MDRTQAANSSRGAGDRSLSSASTASETLILTPASSEAGGGLPSPAHAPVRPAAPAGPLRVTTLSPTSWRPQYPRIGQFAMTISEEVVAASPSGLIFFKRVKDHPSKPWSEPRPFPPTTARLNASTVTGLTVHSELETRGVLHVCCVANGVLYAFSRSGDSEDPGSFIVDSSPPFAGSHVSGTPAVARIEARYDDQNWCIVTPCQTGGMLFTATDSSRSSGYYGQPKQGWEPASQVAREIGIISAVSVASICKSRVFTGFSDSSKRDLVAVCIASGRLHSVEGPLERISMPAGGHSSWQSPKATKIQHPGEVTGNPVLLKKYENNMDRKLDLLVPSAEGGIFHFVRTPTSPDEWHMIGRVKFPSGVPMVSSMSCARHGDNNYYRSAEFRAHVQCGGGLFLITTSEGARPWAGSQLHRIEGPGPFPY